MKSPATEMIGSGLLLYLTSRKNLKPVNHSDAIKSLRSYVILPTNV